MRRVFLGEVLPWERLGYTMKETIVLKNLWYHASSSVEHEKYFENGLTEVTGTLKKEKKKKINKNKQASKEQKCSDIFFQHLCLCLPLSLCLCLSLCLSLFLCLCLTLCLCLSLTLTLYARAGKLLFWQILQDIYSTQKSPVEKQSRSVSRSR